MIDEHVMLAAIRGVLSVVGFIGGKERCEHQRWRVPTQSDRIVATMQHRFMDALPHAGQFPFVEPELGTHPTSCSQARAPGTPMACQF